MNLRTHVFLTLDGIQLSTAANILNEKLRGAHARMDSDAGIVIVRGSSRFEPKAIADILYNGMGNSMRNRVSIRYGKIEADGLGHGTTYVPA